MNSDLAAAGDLSYGSSNFIAINVHTAAMQAAWAASCPGMMPNPAVRCRSPADLQTGWSVYAASPIAAISYFPGL